MIGTKRVAGPLRGRRIANSGSFLRRRAFGCNDDNTCSAVALGIALNYLSAQFHREFVVKELASEMRTAGERPGRDFVAENYPNAHRLHRFIAEECGMGAVSYGDGITVPFKKFTGSELCADKALKLRWTLAPRAATLKANIDRNLPVLVTTTLAGDLSWHTMVAYGYRDTKDGLKLLVHNGWYGGGGSAVNGDACIQPETWIDRSKVTYAYYFTIPDEDAGGGK